MITYIILKIKYFFNYLLLHIQLMFLRHLIDYKIMSGKYIIYEGTNQGKIYDDISHKLIYEGELLKGKKKWKRKGIRL